MLAHLVGRLIERRGWVEKADVLSTRGVAEVKRLVRATG
jgi:hypothetical protein